MIMMRDNSIELFQIHRVHETIERFQKTQVNAFREKVSNDILTDFHVRSFLNLITILSSYFQLAGHMEDLIDTANKKYQQWVKTLSATNRT